MFNSTLYQRHNLFQYAPATFIFMHWTVGVMYLFYFASFLLLLKEMLRPGVFWFLKNFNDPNFNPIQDVSDDCECLWAHIFTAISISDDHPISISPYQTVLHQLRNALFSLIIYDNWFSPYLGLSYLLWSGSRISSFASVYRGSSRTSSRVRSRLISPCRFVL